MGDEQSSNTLGDSLNTAASAGQVLEMSERVSVLENSLSGIQRSLQRLVDMQPQGQSKESPGMSFNPPGVSMSNLSANAPPFVAISGSSSVSNEGQSSSSCSVPINVPEANLPVYSSTPSLVLPKDWLSLTSQLFMTQSSCSGLTIGGALSPVPDYIVKMVTKGLFVDFVLLRPCNLPYLPPVEPVGSQLEKLLKCEKNSDLRPIQSFLDWSEAWCVYAAIVFHVKKESVGGLLSYFLLISKMSRDTEQLGLGWLQYDRLFRKKAAGNASVSWGEYDIPLYVAHVLNKKTFWGFSGLFEILF